MTADDLDPQAPADPAAFAATDPSTIASVEPGSTTSGDPVVAFLDTAPVGFELTRDANGFRVTILGAGLPRYGFGATVRLALTDANLLT